MRFCVDCQWSVVKCIRDILKKKNYSQLSNLEKNTNFRKKQQNKKSNIHNCIITSQRHWLSIGKRSLRIKILFFSVFLCSTTLDLFTSYLICLWSWSVLFCFFVALIFLNSSYVLVLLFLCSTLVLLLFSTYCTIVLVIISSCFILYYTCCSLFLLCSCSFGLFCRYSALAQLFLSFNFPFMLCSCSIHTVLLFCLILFLFCCCNILLVLLLSIALPLIVLPYCSVQTLWLFYFCSTFALVLLLFCFCSACVLLLFRSCSTVVQMLFCVFLSLDISLYFSTFVVILHFVFCTLVFPCFSCSNLTGLRILIYSCYYLILLLFLSCSALSLTLPLLCSALLFDIAQFYLTALFGIILIFLFSGIMLMFICLCSPLDVVFYSPSLLIYVLITLQLW